MSAVSFQNNQPSNTDILVFKPEMSKLLDLTVLMINNKEIKTDIEFAKKFMFSFDSKEQFPINLEMLVEMKIYDRKDSVKKKLSIFTKEVDYTIKIFAPICVGAKKEETRGGSNKENIFLTVECFKTLCMIVNNEIGRKTQQYYLDLEKVFKRYVVLEFQQSQLQLKNIEKEKNHFMRLHNQMTQKHSYFKFKKGPCFYIVTSGMNYVDVKYEAKIGIAG